MTDANIWRATSSVRRAHNHKTAPSLLLQAMAATCDVLIGMRQTPLTQAATCVALSRMRKHPLQPIGDLRCPRRGEAYPRARTTSAMRFCLARQEQHPHAHNTASKPPRKPSRLQSNAHIVMHQASLPCNTLLKSSGPRKRRRQMVQRCFRGRWSPKSRVRAMMCANAAPVDLTCAHATSPAGA
jgi:hypothetical protein